MLQPRLAKMDRLGAMETFVKVVETGSFSKAAGQLGIGQPAVSKAVAQLEERLGVKLLLRTTRGVTATEAGRSFYERALRALEEANEADLAARGAGSGLTGRLRVSAPVTFASQNVIPFLREFLDAHPALSVELLMDDRHVSLVEEGIDLALRMGVLADSSFVARRLACARRLVFASPEYLQRAGLPGTPSDLSQHEAVLYESGPHPGRWTFTRENEEVSVTLQGRLKCSAAEGVRAAVRAGLGLAVASEWMFAAELRSGEVKSVLTDWHTRPMELWALYPSGRLPSAKACAFADFVASLMRYSLEE
jgi:DNA-binding transcriptional LysR family regulator